MKHIHRLNHLRIWLLLSVLIPLGLILALLLRPVLTPEEQRPAAAGLSTPGNSP